MVAFHHFLLLHTSPFVAMLLCHWCYHCACN